MQATVLQSEVIQRIAVDDDDDDDVQWTDNNTV